MATIAGLSGLAITQPLLDVFGRNSEFFVSARLDPGTIVRFALIVALVPTAVLWLVGVLGSAVNRRVGDLLHQLTVGLLAAAFAAGVLRQIGPDRLAVALVVAALAAGGAALLEHRIAPFRNLLQFLAVANVAFLVLFLFASRTSELLHPAPVKVGHVEVPDPKHPIVFLILDEFPLATILGPAGMINAERFPNLARLSTESTWFRNSASTASVTHRAVPAMLSGRSGDPDALPILADHPRNLVTLLGHDYEVHSYELLTDLCPDDVCAAQAPGTLGQALHDATVFYGHHELPATLRAHLPPIDAGWGGFGGLSSDDVTPAATDQAAGGSDEGSTTSTTLAINTAHPNAKLDALGKTGRSPQAQSELGYKLADAIDDRPALNFIHLGFPHAPWRATPFGHFGTAFPPRIKEEDSPGFEFSTRQIFQMHTLQAMAADQLLGHLIDHLEDIGVWDEAMVVVTSDHGTSLLPPVFGRDVVAANADSVLRNLFFIKDSGQKEGDLRDDPASVLDVLPSMIDLLGIETDWRFEGHSLFDGSRPTATRRVSDDVDPLFEVADRLNSRFRDGTVDGLAAFGELGDLIGRSVDDATIGSPSSLRLHMIQRPMMASLPNPPNDTMPYFLNGTVDTDDGQPPAEFVIAVNGDIAGIGGGFVPEGGRFAWRAYVTDRYRRGANDVVGYEVERRGDDTILHPIAED